MEQELTTMAGLTEELAALRQEVDDLKLMSARTKHAEEEYARFFAQSLELLCIVGFDGYFKRMNPMWATQLGWTLEELGARPFLDFVHPDDHADTLAQVDALNKGKGIIRLENRYRHKDGSYRWLRWNARSVADPLRIFASARDVTRQKRLEREILEIIDQERDRLGRDLHDGLCQTLAGIAALSSTLSRRLARGSESAAALDAHEISTLLNEAIVEARNIAHGFGPLGLHGVGLEAMLQTLALNIHYRFCVSCTLDCDWPIERLGNDTQAHLYRIAQEAVNNAVVHGHAKRIEINLGTKNGEGFLRIRDDGMGVSEVADATDGIGMHTMAYRSRLIGGFLEVRRRTLRGTTVNCAFPVPATNDTGEAPDHDRDGT
jgi:PAS domain S-box-containing protein